MNSGCGKATSPNPRFATSVPRVRWATDAPTMVDSVHIEFDEDLAERLVGRPRGVQVQRLRDSS